MQDKSFLQAMQDLQDRISFDSYQSIFHMLSHRTTVAGATMEIQDKTVRALITDELIMNQIMGLLQVTRDLGMLDKAQYDEFISYLQRLQIDKYKFIFGE